MTTNNNNSHSNRNYDNGNNERHSYSNRNYNSDRRSHQSDDRYRSSGDGNYRQSYNNNDNYQSSREGGYRQGGEGNYNRRHESGQEEGGMRRRRPRVGDRSGSSTGGGFGQRGGGDRSYGAPNDRRRAGQPTMGGPKRVLKKKKPFKQIKYKENADPTTPIRLNKYLANAGVCSRREADEFIEAGLVKVNGEVISELGTKITRADEVMFNNQVVSLESKVYVLLNKPKGFVTTTDDPENRKTVMDLVKAACTERIYPVGRLDRGTTGVLLLTNDGDLASKLTHPKYEKRKIYQVWLDKPVAMEHMQMIADGMELEDGEIHADAISYVTEEDLSQVGIEIHSGRNRIVRRIFESLGYRVIKLDRVYFAGLTKKSLSRGKWRYLSEKEVNMLRMGAFD